MLMYTLQLNYHAPSQSDVAGNSFDPHNNTVKTENHSCRD